MATRDEIIEAIRQTTKKNLGKPLGRGKFLEQTGIKESDWSGKYWASWSDAVIEAGFEANKTPDKIDDLVLLDKLISVIRYYKKLPTVSERRLYNKTIDKDFPVHSINNHFPTRESLFTSLADYVQGKSEFKDVAILCKQSISEEKESIKKPTEGHVYLFKSGEHYKIDKTSNLERRVREITIALPESLTIIHTISTDDPDGIEAYWHKRFASSRVRGEWFKLSATDVAIFKKRKSQ
mgnify:CR=1 FL=1